MRLVCPRCGAQYEIDGAAIPPAGRDVECSACDHVWRALPPPESFDPAARPQLSRPLSDSVIEILREEAARELEVRATERRALRVAERTAALTEPGTGDQTEGGRIGEAVDDVSPAPANRPFPYTGTQGGMDEAGRVAETAAPLLRQTDASSPSADALGLRVARTVPGSAQPTLCDDNDPAPNSGATGQSVVVEPAPVAGRTYPSAASAPSGSIPAQPLPTIPARTSRSGYNAGFGLAMIVAVVAVALYALAPRLSGTGPLGAVLADWRSGVDEGRDWLALKGDALTGRLNKEGGE